jgi:hypothetical protein
MHVFMLQAATRPDRMYLATTLEQAAETSREAEPGTLTPEEIREIVLEILG